MKPGRIVLLVLGSLLAIMGMGLLAGGGVVGWALATQRDADGFFTTSVERVHTDSYAVTSDAIDLGDRSDDWWADRKLATVRVVVDGVGNDVFVGIGPEADVEGYLADVPHDDVTGLVGDELRYRREHPDGAGVPVLPDEQPFWVASSTGVTTRTLTWDLEPGVWTVVVMNADASPNVAADVELGGKLDHLTAIAIGLAAAGLVLLAVGVVLILVSVTHHTTGVGDAVAAPLVEHRAHPHPLQLEARLDEPLSRWKWLVKWFFAIPHVIVLVFLWIAFVVTTVVAGIAIVVTGRYPRRLFDFNVGVLRWTWRVSCYASTGGLGTDRYPPFTLEAADYPATLELEYPEHLSRGLVLVKSWLLALPQLLVVALLTSTWNAGGGDDGRAVFAGGLIGLLVVVAAVVLLVRNAYPARLFDLVIGLNRWVYRVIVYVALMTDRYPPFALDQGPLEPDAVDVARP